MPLDDATEIGSSWERAEGVAPITGQSTGAVGVRNRLVAVADQEGSLEGDRHPLDDAAGASLDRLEVAGNLVLELSDVGVELRFGPGALHHLGEEGVDRGRVLDHCAQHVEALDVARALPDRGEGRLAVEAGQARLLDVAIATQALEALDRVRGVALAEPILEHGVCGAAGPLRLRIPR